MLRESHLEIVRTNGTRLGAMLMGTLFFVSGVYMLSISASGISFFQTLGIPAAAFWFWPLMIIKILAGLALILGKRTTEAASFLIVYTLVATMLVHLSSKFDPTFPTGLLKNLAVVGGLLYVLAYGPHGMDVKGDEA